MEIKEIIVVEGKDDTVAIKRAVNADTIETNGSAISAEVLTRIRHAQEKRGVIVMTDPDYPGRRIRAIIEEHIPGVKHAFLDKRDSIAKNGKGLGIEHASDEAIRACLKNVYTMTDTTFQSTISKEWLIQEKLIGHPSSKRRRELLGAYLQIGYTNGKQLEKRLRMFQIDEALFIEALQHVNQEEHS
ncbi:ribonuclease M5 [Paenisporosarcina cavernae]|uniref:Ribonuclease M5 n=1 Tax=Paenisporosarcina cavernae TaxID=2320858 RepID=A0A385YXR7_9BACL|nr:ribonuclease M5 [Paenisporosarcina cavernae]AYC30707.1 ribonuclease M5 [Paenisporosarcina cavernae]